MGALHPEVVHFAIALLFVGVLLRALSLFGRPAFVGPTAAVLLILGTVAAFAAAYTGDVAHGPIEQMPGLRPTVESHEVWGDWVRNVFGVVLLVELLALALRPPKRRYALMASTIVGVIGLGVLYVAGERGGEIVYAYAGGIGTRSGDPQHVSNLLRAGLYQQALADRKAGRLADAGTLLDFAAARFPADVDVQLAQAESLLLDRKDPNAALTKLRALTPPSENRAARIRHGLLTADALEAVGQHDGAVATLQQLQAAVPSPRVQQRLDTLNRRSGAGH